MQARAGNLGLVIIDYLHLMGDKQPQGISTSVHLGEMCKRVKNIARELDIPVMLLCQMNREIEKRADHDPQLSDIRDTGQLEQDADVVVFVNRPERYEEGKRPGEADIIVAKQRQGPTGKITLGFNGAHVKFTSRSHREEPGW